MGMNLWSMGFVWTFLHFEVDEFRIMGRMVPNGSLRKFRGRLDTPGGESTMPNFSRTQKSYAEDEYDLQRKEQKTKTNTHPETETCFKGVASLKQ